MRLLLRDLWLHLKRTICLLRRKHLRAYVAGDLVKRGFRGVEVWQCTFCAEMWIRAEDAKRLGGRPA